MNARRKKLNQELMDSRKRILKWGEHDCVTLAARCAQAITGKPYVSRLAKYVYADAREALALVRKSSLRDLIARELGDPVPWPQCRMGDLVLCEHDSAFGAILTVHDGAQLIGPAEKGIRRVPMSLARCGWRID